MSMDKEEEKDYSREVGLKRLVTLSERRPLNLSGVGVWGFVEEQHLKNPKISLANTS